MLAAGLMFAVLDGLIKLMRPEFRVWHISFFRWGIGIVLLITIFGRHSHLFKTHNLKLMTIRSIIGCFTFLCLTSAIRNIPISTALVLFFSFPAFAALFSYLLFGERISKGQIVCIVGALIGVAVLLGFKFDGNLYGYIMGLLSGVFAGITVNLVKFSINFCTSFEAVECIPSLITRACVVDDQTAESLLWRKVHLRA